MMDNENNVQIQEDMDEKKMGRSNRCALCLTDEDASLYKDVAKIKRFLNERNMIIPRQKTRLCSYHQRKLSQAVKKARFLSLLPVGGRKNI